MVSVSWSPVGVGVRTAEWNADNTQTAQAVTDVHLQSSPQEYKKALVGEPKAKEQGADNTQTVTGTTSPVYHEKLEQSREDGGSLKDLLQGAESVVYEARDATTGISFVKNGRREWIPVVVTKLRGGEMSAAETDKCKRIVYFEKENSLYFLIWQGKLLFPTPIA